uniref:3-hydroxyacyl-[acyl-carrier-protein] dehydratase n=1 Tax=Opuntia streptacantha TaxID=393608 RepID=A0A7C9DWN0_OPUST
MTMNSKRLLSSLISFSKFSSNSEADAFKIGDILRQTRVFTNADVVEYSKPGAVYVSQSLQFKQPVYIGEEIIGEVQAMNVRELRKKHLVKFSTRCLKDGDILVLDGEATAILPTTTIELQRSKEWQKW